MKKLILEYQNKWASGIVEIGKTKSNFKESVSVSTKFINDLNFSRTNDIEILSRIITFITEISIFFLNNL